MYKKKMKTLAYDVMSHENFLSIIKDFLKRRREWVIIHVILSTYMTTPLLTHVKLSKPILPWKLGNASDLANTMISYTQHHHHAQNLCSSWMTITHTQS